MYPKCIQNLRKSSYQQRIHYPLYDRKFNTILTQPQIPGCRSNNQNCPEVSTKKRNTTDDTHFQWLSTARLFPGEMEASGHHNHPEKRQKPLPANYQPIALFSSISKLFEKVILMKIKAATDTQIRQEQFAFRKHHSVD